MLVVNVYVPDLMYTVSPAATLLHAFASVPHAAPSLVPAALSVPLVVT
jgi:hypothetical protein